MSDIEIVIQRSRKLEALLKGRYHAKGRGLHALVSSVERQLPRDIVPGLRWVATMRNKVVHEDSFRLKSTADFQREAGRLEKALKDNAPGGWPSLTRMIPLVLFVTAAWYFLR
jgi:hypothetical protein